MIKAVLFDVDGVLLDSKEANVNFYQNLMEAAGYPKPPKAECEKVFHRTLWDVVRILAKVESEEEIRRIWNIGGQKRELYHSELLKVPEHAKEVVEELSKSYKLGIVSSRIKEGMGDFFRIFGLKEKFDVVITFQDSAKHKPDPEPLLIAAQKLGVRPEEAVYIGDAETDIRAAKAAGMKVVHYLYVKKTLEGADAVIDSFQQLPSAIRQF